MTSLSMPDLASKMKGIDIAILSTHSESGQIAGRPMSNNGDVAYDGDSYYFTFEESHTVSDIERDPKVALSFTGKTGLLGKSVYIEVQGAATLIREKAQFKAHWTPDLDIWFKDGADTPNVVLVKVSATRIKYWDGTDQGELTP